MTKLLLLVAATGLTVSGAAACEFQKSVKNKVDATVVASIETPAPAMQSTPVALPEAPLPTTDAAE